MEIKETRGHREDRKRVKCLRTINEGGNIELKKDREERSLKMVNEAEINNQIAQRGKRSGAVR